MNPIRTSFDDEFDDGPMEWEEYDVELPPSEAEVRAATAPCNPAPTVLDSSPSPSPTRSETTATATPSVHLPLQEASPSTEQSSASSPPAPPPAAVNPIDGPASQQSRKRMRRKAPPVGYYKAMKERRFTTGPPRNLFLAGETFDINPSRGHLRRNRDRVRKLC